jgi:ABC-type branched-subunit amino acid transport system substrate-binding protein
MPDPKETRLIRHPFRIFIISAIAFMLVACSSKAESTYAGILAANDEAPSIAAEQMAGYQLKQDTLGFTLTSSTESVLQDEIQKSVRGMVENKKAPVIAIVGATSNQATTRSAALVNFFNVPMIIPTASGDNLMPSNNLWAFRISAPGSSYAGYMFGDILNKNNINNLDIDPEFLQNFKIAILYEQNTYGETAAVAAAQSAMKQKVEIDVDQSLSGMEIAVYASFPDKNPDADSLNNLATQAKEQGVQLVYLVTNDPVIAQKLVQAFRAQYAIDETPLPVLIGQSGAFASQVFMQTPEAADVYTLRQQWNHDRCPEEITSAYAGQSYGAAYLLDHAVDVARESLPQQKFSLNNADAQAEQIIQFRENVRDSLKQIQLDVPCVGMVSFDNTGQNKNLKFELIKVKNNFESIISTPEFLELLKQRILVEPF